MKYQSLRAHILAGGAAGGGSSKKGKSAKTGAGGDMYIKVEEEVWIRPCLVLRFFITLKPRVE